MRLQRLDMFRGVAILLMVLFHINYSLVNIFGIEFFNFSELFWYIVGKISAIGFIFIAGISLFLAGKKYGISVWKKYFKYGFILAVLASLISWVTYFVFPDQYIRFWILHFFALSFFLLPFFSGLWYWNILLAGGIIIYGIYFLPIVENPYFYWIGFKYPWFTSADYYPLIPYFWVLLWGYSFALILERYQKLGIFQTWWKQHFPGKFLSKTGKYSLLIYILHQPIIIGLIFICQFLGIL